MKKRKSSLGWLWSALAVVAVVLLVRHFHIKNFHVVEHDVLYTSGQPRGMDYTRLLYKYHIATIVNVRSVVEHREKNWYNEEITWVRNHGVRYEPLPIDRTVNRRNYFPDEATQKKFLEIMSKRENLPVLLHGSSGRKRVSMLVAVWLRKAKGASIEQTIATVERIKGQPVTPEEKEFIEGL